MEQMYNQFFGFKERPFQLVPNPAYFFLSRAHEEAMAHLIYAIAQGDGFVEITGEVGTGKTTLCRAFLESLGPETEVAYIFNPKLDALQLLKTINDEFGISSQADNIKELVDTLNRFLMRNKAQGRQAIVLIDEAQELSHDVLEQLRLLSNLETSTSKLLQIVMVGQPELAEMLDSHELRQMAQRITLSCHLSPLSCKETGNYIRHRLHVASQKPGVVFTRSALRAIHRYSAGIPRLVNIACDRALLTAFGLNKTKITGGIAKASIRELSGRGNLKHLGFQVGARSPFLLAASIVLFVALLSVVSAGIFFYGPEELGIRQRIDSKETESLKITQKVTAVRTTGEKPASDPAILRGGETPSKENEPGLIGKEGIPRKAPKLAAPLGTVKAAVPLKEALRETDPRSSRQTALMGALRLWYEHPEISPSLEAMEDDYAFFRTGAKMNGLQVHRIEGDISLIRKLRHPAILEFEIPEEPGPRYLTLARIGPRELSLRGEGKDGTIEVDLDQVWPYWSRVAYVVWRDFLNYPGAISGNASGDSVVALKMLLRDIGYHDIEMSPSYDSRTVETVKKIQEGFGLEPDGIVGPMTKMVLYGERSSLNIPLVTE
jgi:general secretion pathway protein A